MSPVETTAAERESWSALEAVPNEDEFQRLVSDADRAAELRLLLSHAHETE